jgi:hypothetical protein
MSEKRVKVTFKRNGFKTEMRESIAKIYEAKGKVEIEKGKPGRPKKAEEPKPEPKPEEQGE